LQAFLFGLFEPFSGEVVTFFNEKLINDHTDIFQIGGERVKSPFHAFHGGVEGFQVYGDLGFHGGGSFLLLYSL
jgi:hypothetical protein